MQTFVPFPSFAETAACLDRQRLGKQRLETKQILQTLLGEIEGWPNHPATTAWEGYEEGLAVYGLYVSAEWRERGYKDNQFVWFQEKRLELRTHRRRFTKFPPWVSDTAVNIAYQELLMWKDPDHYAGFFPYVMEPFIQPEFPWEALQ